LRSRIMHLLSSFLSRVKPTAPYISLGQSNFQAEPFVVQIVFLLHRRMQWLFPLQGFHNCCHLSFGTVKHSHLSIVVLILTCCSGMWKVDWSTSSEIEQLYSILTENLSFHITHLVC
jgi:hypothetical protein